MSKAETKFIKSVHDKLNPDVYYLKTHPQFTSGEWDVWYEGPKYDLWVEYKQIELPKKYSTIIDITGLLSEKQIKWGNRRAAAVRKKGDRLLPAVCVGTKHNEHWYGYITFNWERELQITKNEFLRDMKASSDVAQYIETMVGM